MYEPHHDGCLLVPNTQRCSNVQKVFGRAWCHWCDWDVSIHWCLQAVVSGQPKSAIESVTPLQIHCRFGTFSLLYVHLFQQSTRIWNFNEFQSFLLPFQSFCGGSCKVVPGSSLDCESLDVGGPKFRKPLIFRRALWHGPRASFATPWLQALQAMGQWHIYIYYI